VLDESKVVGGALRLPLLADGAEGIFQASLGAALVA
jgi:hypothetical protein